MDFNILWRWGIALLIVITLAGCGADATNSKKIIRDGYTATDSSEILPEVQANKNEQVLRSLSAAAEARSLMLPTSNIMENIARADSLTKFTALLRKSEMVKKLKGTGPYTLFAPSDVALKARYGNTLKDLLKPENKEQLQQLVNTHMVAGNLTVSDLENGATLITAGGRQLKVAKKGSQVSINDAVVAIPDATCRNGVVHVVDKVLEAEL